MNPSAIPLIPIAFGSANEARSDDAVLQEGRGASAAGHEWFTIEPGLGHPMRCACCTPRNAAGRALGRLLLARGRGTAPFFGRVVVAAKTDAGREAVLAAVADDPLASACFRWEE
jgi:hypothetical protein